MSKTLNKIVGKYRFVPDLFDLLMNVSHPTVLFDQMTPVMVSSVQTMVSVRWTATVPLVTPAHLHVSVTPNGQALTVSLGFVS